MAIPAPYIVKHLQPDAAAESFYAHEPGRYYYTFWWKQIPLGHCYLENEDTISHRQFLHKILEAIAPAIDFYASKNDIASGDYKQAFLRADFDQFRSIMNEIFYPGLITGRPGMLDVSVIICTRNRSGDLEKCLRSLASQAFSPRQIIVVDNAPGDDSTHTVVKQFPGVMYHKEEKPGLSFARNAGLQIADASIIAFTDDDVILHPDWLYRLWETFLSPGVTAMTGLVLPASLETESQQLFEKYWSFNKGYRDKIFNEDFINQQLEKGPPVWEIGAGANMAFRKSLFDDIEHFDLRLGAGASGCSEDSELWYRILLNGYNVHYNPRAVVFHRHRKDLRGFRKQMNSYIRGHVAAALIQQKLNQKAGYKKRVFREYPMYYTRRLVKGFPAYKAKEKTLFTEVLGWCAGILFYHKNREKPSRMVSPHNRKVQQAMLHSS